MRGSAGNFECQGLTFMTILSRLSGTWRHRATKGAARGLRQAACNNTYYQPGAAVTGVRPRAAYRVLGAESWAVAGLTTRDDRQVRDARLENKRPALAGLSAMELAGLEPA